MKQPHIAPIALFLLSVFVLTANAGDYGLVISDDSVASCAPPIASRESLDNPIRTSSEVTEDIYRYFRGENPSLEIFKGAFSNGHVQFCGEQEKRNIYLAFLRILHYQKISHENDLYDFMFVLGNRDFLKMIADEISKKNESMIQERLFKAEKAVSKRYKKGT